MNSTAAEQEVYYLRISLAEARRLNADLLADRLNADLLEALKHALQALSDATAKGQIDSAQWQDVRRECRAVIAKAKP